MIQILCREQHDDEVEQEVTQRDQFNTDEVTLVATLVREPHQNSLDAPDGSDGPVRTRLQVVEPSASNSNFFTDLFKELVPHLRASGIDVEAVNLGMPRVLIIEDFGTTGLTGDFSDKKDRKPFNNFWRRIGSSSKGGTAGGRWGLGKLVFSSASQIQTFFGLTVRYDDAQRTPYLMGQAVLSNHELDGKAYAPHVFFAEASTTGLQLPVSDKTIVEKFRTAFGLTRQGEPGLSIAIPFILPQITEQSLVPEVLKNYFFPILTGQLIVEVGSELISEKTFDDVSARHGWATPEQNNSLVEFVRELNQANKPDAILKESWIASIEQALDDATLERLRIKLGNEAGLVHVRAPITLKRKDGTLSETFFDLFLKKTPDGKKGSALYVRSSITVPDEARYFTSRQTLGALVAKHEGITSFLGDAENPAHTKWNGQADKLKNWKNASAKLREIRTSLNRLQNSLMQAIETVEPDALSDLFSLKDPIADKKKPVGGIKPKPSPIPPPPPPVPPIPSSKAWYRIDQSEDGFRVRPGSGINAENLPFEINVKIAYDVRRRDAFKRFSSFDFDLNKKPIKIENIGANYLVVAANELTITVISTEFSIEVHGFDSKRDLIVQAAR